MTTSNDEPIIQYWDACLFIDYLMDNGEPKSARSTTFETLINIAEKRGIKIALSYFILAEVRPKKRDTASQRKIESLLESDRFYIQWFGLTRAIALRARRIGIGYKINPADALHLATALEAKAESFFTYDGKRENKPDEGLLALKEIRDPGMPGSPTLKIEQPWVSLGPLFDNRSVSASEAKAAEDAQKSDPKTTSDNPKS